MINALFEPFPESVKADGREYPILTDFREWIRFFEMLKDTELSEWEKIRFLMEWVEGVEKISKNLIDALFSFYRADDLELRKSPIQNHYQQLKKIRVAQEEKE